LFERCLRVVVFLGVVSDWRCNRKALGLEVAAFLDRDATTISKNSINFIDFVAVPLFQLLGKLYPDFDEQVVQKCVLRLLAAKELLKPGCDVAHAQQKTVGTRRESKSGKRCLNLNLNLF
jgi:hypothetical protein